MNLNDILIQAAKDGNLLVLKSALEKGADINAKDKNGWTALMWALKNGHKDIAEFLREKGAAKQKLFESEPILKWKILFGRVGHGIMLMNSDGTGLTNLLLWGEMPDVSPDGSKIVFISGYDFDYSSQSIDKGMYYLTQMPMSYYLGRFSPSLTLYGGYTHIISSPEIYLLDLGKSLNQMSDPDFLGIHCRFSKDSLRPLTKDDELGSSSPRFSPDGQRIAFLRTKNNESQLWIMNIDGSDLRQITRGESIYEFSWIDNEKIAFSQFNDGWFVIDFISERIERLNILEKDDYCAFWDKTGENIAFFNANNLYIMGRDGKNREKIGRFEGASGGSFSPDNKWIVISSKKMSPNGANIFIIRKDGKYEKRLTNDYLSNDDVGGDFEPCWVPF